MAADIATFVPACDACKAAMSSLEKLRVCSVLRCHVLICHALIHHVLVCHVSMRHDCLAHELKSSMWHKINYIFLPCR